MKLLKEMIAYFLCPDFRRHHWIIVAGNRNGCAYRGWYCQRCHKEIERYS
jgi:hypothetical protein